MHCLLCNQLLTKSPPIFVMTLDIRILSLQNSSVDCDSASLGLLDWLHNERGTDEEKSEDEQRGKKRFTNLLKWDQYHSWKMTRLTAWGRLSFYSRRPMATLFDPSFPIPYFIDVHHKLYLKYFVRTQETLVYILGLGGFHISIYLLFFSCLLLKRLFPSSLWSHVIRFASSFSRHFLVSVCERSFKGCSSGFCF